MSGVSACMRRWGNLFRVAAGTHRMELGVNDGCSSDGLSGQSIDPAKVRKQWQAAVSRQTRRTSGGFLAPEGAQKKVGFHVACWVLASG
jgi:hypothetical protein